MNTSWPRWNERLQVGAGFAPYQVSAQDGVSATEDAKASETLLFD